MWSVGTILNGLLSFMTDTAQVLQPVAPLMKALQLVCKHMEVMT